MSLNTSVFPRGVRPLCTLAAVCAATGWGAAADIAKPTVTRTELGFYGLPSVIDMPTADMMPDGEFAFTASTFAGQTRSTLAFQIAPRLMGSFRYSSIRNWNSDGFDIYYDRSFDLRLQLLTETARRPSITIGLQDFIGTGVYSGEFIAASKSFGDSLTVSGGLGWGRLGSYNPIGSTGTRPVTTPDEVGTGGTVNSDVWFRGDVALFGGVVWRPTPKWTFHAEYSSDAYVQETEQRDIFDRKSPLNFGAEYAISRDFKVGGYFMYGSEIGVQLQVNLNPARPPVVGGQEPAGSPVYQRPSRAQAPELYTTAWVGSEPTRITIRDALADALLAEGMEMEALHLDATEATLYLRNKGYRSGAQAIGRSLRLMSTVMPPSVDTFTIVPMVTGLELPSVTYARSAVEQNVIQADGAEQMLAIAAFGTAPDEPAAEDYAPFVYPRFTWSLGPYVSTSLFDPANPFRMDVGVQLTGAWQPAPGWLFAGTVQKKLIGNLDQNSETSASTLPHVRSDFTLYNKYGDPAMRDLYGAYYFQGSSEVYGRLTAGYLERMYAGVSGEVLWAPFDKRYALGAELNYVKQRDYDGGFGMLDYEVATGFVTGYWQFTDDFFARLDVGRYLAGDVGATLGLERTFANGWKIGAFATKTDVSAEDFGEGSFDKGIVMEIPIDWFLGRPTRVTERIVIRPLTRDGGARVDVPGQLYQAVNDSRKYKLEEQWGQFWR
ncbi:YjbH domain-containing protein [Meridianimarinicoccus sp. MJW13]|uniref:YjbH domain-containing protein n=1 Tax=Meridianimarinicoccus sp. MJW13 TaxID=2720031 RepID=UPI001867CAC0|nr:YjbH domain-containing protein [Fluviibacterium sp. MJW13]